MSSDALKLEVARLRAQHHVHDAARIIGDAAPDMPADKSENTRMSFRALEAIEQQLTDLGGEQ